MTRGNGSDPRVVVVQTPSQPNLPVVKEPASHADIIKSTATVLGACVAIFASIWSGVNYVVSEAKAESTVVAGDAGRKVQELRQDFEQFKLDQAQQRREDRAIMFELQGDVRGLYKYMKSGREQPRLEREVVPHIDGGK